jgi:hypothetical protein
MGAKCSAIPRYPPSDFQIDFVKNDRFLEQNFLLYSSPPLLMNRLESFEEFRRVAFRELPHRPGGRETYAKKVERQIGPAR